MSKILGVHVPTSPQNKIINGNMDFWQRGILFTPSGLTLMYGDGRWQSDRTGTGTATNVSRNLLVEEL